MFIKDFNRQTGELTPAQALFDRVVGDFRHRAPLAKIGLGFRVLTASIHWNSVPYRSLSLDDGEWVWHVAFIDKEPNKVHMLQTRTNAGEFGFQTWIEVDPLRALYLSFDMAEFFYRRIGHYALKPLEVEKMLKHVYNDVPEEYSQKMTLDAQQRSSTPVVTGSFRRIAKPKITQDHDPFAALKLTTPETPRTDKPVGTDYSGGPGRRPLHRRKPE